MEFRGLAVSEPESGQVRFTGYTKSRGGETAVIVCHISHKTLASIANNQSASTGELMRAFERYRPIIEAVAREKFARGEGAPIVTVRDILMKRH